MIESKSSHIASNLIRVNIFYPKKKSPRTQIWFDEDVSYRDITNFANRFASLSVDSDFRLLFAGGYEPPATFKRKTDKSPHPVVITTKLPITKRRNNGVMLSNQPQWRKKIKTLDTIIEVPELNCDQNDNITQNTTPIESIHSYNHDRSDVMKVIDNMIEEIESNSDTSVITEITIKEHPFISQSVDIGTYTPNQLIGNPKPEPLRRITRSMKNNDK